MAAPVTHFEISAKDGQRAQEFYSTLFGWKITAMPEMAYGMVDTDVKMGINGGIGQVDASGQPSITFYVQVEDPQAYLDRVVSLGGTICMPVTEVPGMVTFAQFTDPEGNVVGLVKGPQAPPKEEKPKRAATKKAAAKKAPAKRTAAKKTTRRTAAAKKRARR